MNIEVNVDKNYTTPKIVIYTNQVDEDVSNIIDSISSIYHKKLKVYKDEKMYILNQNEIETIYSESGKIYVRCNNELYTIKNRLYELETLLDKKIFVRISNSKKENLSFIYRINERFLLLYFLEYSYKYS